MRAATHRWVCNLHSVGWSVGRRAIMLAVEESKRNKKQQEPHTHTHTVAYANQPSIFIYTREIENRNENLTKFSITSGAK